MIKQRKTKMLTLDSVAEFTWGFGQDFLLECEGKLYIWSDPDYNGNNTIVPYPANPLNFTSEGFCGRAKGTHVVRDYCGPDVQIFEVDIPS